MIRRCIILTSDSGLVEFISLLFFAGLCSTKKTLIKFMSSIFFFLLLKKLSLFLLTYKLHCSTRAQNDTKEQKPDNNRNII